MRLAGRDAVGGGERAEFVDVRAVCANARTDDGGVQRCRLYVLEPELECCETYPEPLGKADEIIVIIQIAGRFG